MTSIAYSGTQLFRGLGGLRQQFQQQQPQQMGAIHPSMRPQFQQQQQALNMQAPQMGQQMRQQMLAREQMMQQQAQQQITPEMESQYGTLQATMQKEKEAYRANPNIGQFVRSPQEQGLLQTFRTARPPPPQQGMQSSQLQGLGMSLPSSGGWGQGAQLQQIGSYNVPPGQPPAPVRPIEMRSDQPGRAVAPRTSEPYVQSGPQQLTVQDQVASLPAGFARPLSPRPSAGGGGGGGGGRI